MMEKKKTVGIISLAIMLEGIITYVNQFFVAEIFQWKMFLSICLGVLVAVAYKLDLPEYFEMKSKIPYIGCILTGILIARGSNYICDLFSIISNSR